MAVNMAGFVGVLLTAGLGEDSDISYDTENPHDMENLNDTENLHEPENLDDTEEPHVLTNLPFPENRRIVNGYLRWDQVPNATGYMLLLVEGDTFEIIGRVESGDITFWEIPDIYYRQGEVHFGIIALGDSRDYANAEWVRFQPKLTLHFPGVDWLEWGDGNRIDAAQINYSQSAELNFGACIWTHGIPTVEKYRHKFVGWSRIPNDVNERQIIYDMFSYVPFGDIDVHALLRYGFEVPFIYNEEGSRDASIIHKPDGSSLYWPIPKVVFWHSEGANHGFHTINELMRSFNQYFYPPTRPGYIFDGWDYDGDRDIYVTPGMSFTAKWIPESY